MFNYIICVVDALHEGKRLRIMGDNVNWSVAVHDETLGHTSVLKHGFASAIIIEHSNDSNKKSIGQNASGLSTIVISSIDSTNTSSDCELHTSACDYPIQADDQDRRASQSAAPSSHISTQLEQPSRRPLESNFEELLPSVADFRFTECKYVLQAFDILTDVIPIFAPYKSAIADCKASLGLQGDVSHLDISHDIAVLPLLLKNEQNYGDVVDILDSYEQLLARVGSRANVDIAHLKVQLCGDQLTRDRFSGAKCLRAAHSNPVDRYCHLTHISFGFFHMLMNFLQQIFNRLFKYESVSQKGSLKNLKERLGRKQVSADIKNSFDASSSFMMTVTRAHVVLAALDYFSMTSVHDQPKQHAYSHDQ